MVTLMFDRRARPADKRHWNCAFVLRQRDAGQAHQTSPDPAQLHSSGPFGNGQFAGLLRTGFWLQPNRQSRLQTTVRSETLTKSVRRLWSYRHTSLVGHKPGWNSVLPQPYWTKFREPVSLASAIQVQPSHQLIQPTLQPLVPYAVEWLE